MPCYDIAGNLLFQHSMDAGDRWMINDAAGKPFFAWDENTRITDSGDRIEERRVFHTTYDALHRPLTHQLRINSGAPQIIERFVYGEPPVDPPDPTADNEAKRLNLRGQVIRHYDPSGLITNERFDFKGNLLEIRRRLAQDYAAAAIDWPDDFSDAGLEEETFTRITEYDALNRMVRLWNWHRKDTYITVYEPSYSRRGLLEGETLIIGASRGADGKP